ncbi:hypothetical protein K788_0007078 (plasmid) [Paraburkholderia caribensis MBA4]|uniref:Transcriptional regulator, GntR family n=1 Tax=Paraburkholderia caribensis MBA4 TaxID=1323664 RepID=A0A0P0RRT3_9BURK|nr:hypothetical protein K788_0007078 [Paraburkholderia caribensis MBA4]
MKLYEKLADVIGDRSQRGVLLPGDRIPCVRQTSQNRATGTPESPW